MTQAFIQLKRGGAQRPWVGQLVRFDIEVWRPTLEAAPLPPFEFDELEVPGAIAHFRSEAPPPDEIEKDGQQFLVQHRTLVVFPQTDGALSVPMLVARWSNSDHEHEIQSEPVTFEAAIPPHFSEQLVVSPELDLQQAIKGDLHGLRVGDGFTRTVMLRARDSDPLVLPTLAFDTVAGLSVYPAAPRDTSSAERGQLSATRTFQATYVVERVGHYELEAMSLRWLDPTSGQYHAAVAPHLEFWARPNPALGWSMWGTTGEAQLAGFGLSLTLVVAVVFVARKRLKNGPFGFEHAWHQARAERRAFRQLCGVARRGTAIDTVRSAYEWLRVRFPLRAERTLGPLRNATGPMAERWALIESSAFDQSSMTPVTSSVTNDTPHLLTVARRQLAKQEAEVLRDTSLRLNAPHPGKGNS